MKLQPKATVASMALSRKVDLCAIDGDKTGNELKPCRAGKMKEAPLALLVGFKPAESKITSACFLWTAEHGLKERSGEIQIVIRELFEKGYRLVEDGRRLVDVPFIARFQVSVASKSHQAEEIFSSCGSVIVEVYMKLE